MDLGPPLFSVCVIMSCLIGAARCSNGVKTNCPCPEIPQLPLTQAPSGDCFQMNGRFRYECIQGYVRKAGTSNLIKCEEIDGVGTWKNATLKCIPDPKRTTTQPPTTTTVTTASTSPPETQSVSTSASLTTETESAEPTSLPTNRTLTYAVTETKTTDRTTSTSTTTDPSNNGTVEPHVSDPNLGSAATVAITCASLVIICALIGISSFLCYRRSQNNIPPHTAEEQLPMNHPPAVSAL